MPRPGPRRTAFPVGRSVARVADVADRPMSSLGSCGSRLATPRDPKAYAATPKSFFDRMICLKVSWSGEKGGKAQSRIVSNSSMDVKSPIFRSKETSTEVAKQNLLHSALAASGVARIRAPVRARQLVSSNISDTVHLRARPRPSGRGMIHDAIDTVSTMPYRPLNFEQAARHCPASQSLTRKWTAGTRRTLATTFQSTN